jgi:transporter family protein
MKAELGISVIVLWGLWGFLYKYGISKLGMLKTILLSSTVYAILGLFIVLYFYRYIELSLNITTGAVIAGTISGFAGWILFLYALQKYPGSVIIPLTALYPAVSVILAVLLLKEEIKPINYVGIALALVASYLLVKA